MSLIVKTCTDNGPYYPVDRQAHIVNSLGSLVSTVRICMEEPVDAIAIFEDRKIKTLWLREPDVDCDCDGFYEVAPDRPGQEYVRYRPGKVGFASAAAYYFKYTDN